MKKSEMIDGLAGYLEEQYDLDTSLSAIVLDFLESQGMQPPKIETWRELSGPFEGQGLKVREFVNEWEPENETSSITTDDRQSH